MMGLKAALHHICKLRRPKPAERKLTVFLDAESVKRFNRLKFKTRKTDESALIALEQKIDKILKRKSAAPPGRQSSFAPKRATASGNAPRS